MQPLHLELLSVNRPSLPNVIQLTLLPRPFDLVESASCVRTIILQLPMGLNSYRTSDDPNYTPEKAGEVGSWQAMTLAK